MPQPRLHAQRNPNPNLPPLWIRNAIDASVHEAVQRVVGSCHDGLCAWYAVIGSLMLSDYCHVDQGVYFPWTGGLILTGVMPQDTRDGLGRVVGLGVRLGVEGENEPPGKTHHTWIVRVDRHTLEPNAIVDLSARFYRTYYERAGLHGARPFENGPTLSPLPWRMRYPDSIWATVDAVPEGLEFHPLDPLRNAAGLHHFMGEERATLGEIERWATRGCERRGLRAVEQPPVDERDSA